MIQVVARSLLKRAQPLNLRDFLARYQPQALYHFTDIRNLDSIRQHGLLAVTELELRGVEVPRPGGNEWSREADRFKGVDRYVHLCFVDNHPMEYRARESGHIGDTRYLRIDPSIILSEGVMGCSAVANRRDAKILSIEEALDEIDLETLLGGKVDFSVREQRGRYNEAKKAEILIPIQISTRHILNL